MQVPSALLSAVEGMRGALTSAKNGSADGTSGAFSGILNQAIAAVQEQQSDASAKVNGFLAGEETDVHTVMIASQKASLAFDMALALRNKAVGAYQQLMSMQF